MPSSRSARLAGAVLAALLAAGGAAAQSAPAAPRTRNVVVIMSDGLRWQEVYRGADASLVDEKAGGVEDTAALRQAFVRGSREEARRALLPFFWSTIAGKGQLLGDRDRGGVAEVTNGLKFSYPGYNETLSGHPDPRIDSNGPLPNPNVTVYEWLNGRPGFRGKVAAFGTWDRFAEIFNRERAGFPVRAGWEEPFPEPGNARQLQLDALYRTTTRLWGDLSYDAFLQQAVLEYVRAERPRVLFVGFGETDEWAHLRRYDQYLESAHRVDAFVAELWDSLQAIPQYRDSTTFLLTADHGRGGGVDWTDHGRDVEGAEAIWLAALGPDVPARGVVSMGRVTQAQIAATVAALLGEDYRGSVPEAAPPIAGIVSPATPPKR